MTELKRGILKKQVKKQIPETKLSRFISRSLSNTGLYARCLSKRALEKKGGPQIKDIGK